MQQVIFKLMWVSGAVFPLRKFYTEQMFVLVRMQLRNHVECRHTTSEALQGLLRNKYTILTLECCKCARM